MLMSKEELDTVELDKIKDRQSNPTIPWIYRDEQSDKRKVDIPKLGKTILAEHNCLIVENGNAIKRSFTNIAKNCIIGNNAILKA